MGVIAEILSNERHELSYEFMLTEEEAMYLQKILLKEFDNILEAKKDLEAHIKNGEAIKEQLALFDRQRKFVSETLSVLEVEEEFPSFYKRIIKKVKLC